MTKFICELPQKNLELYIWWKVYDGFIGLHSNEFAARIKGNNKSKQAEYCSSKVHSIMVMAINYAIAPPNFLNETKPHIQQIIDNIRKAFNQHVRNITWMDSNTKQLVLEKSEAMKHLVGLPEWILKDGKLDEHYAGLDFNETTYMKNLIKVYKWQLNKKLKSLNNMEEDTEWFENMIELNVALAIKRNTMSLYICEIFQ